LHVWLENVTLYVSFLWGVGTPSDRMCHWLPQPRPTCQMAFWVCRTLQAGDTNVTHRRQTTLRRRV